MKPLKPLTHLGLLQFWAERQLQVLKDIERQGFKNVISSDETYEEWLEFELKYVLQKIQGEHFEEIEDME